MEPKYRADAKGNIRGIKADCVATFRGEMAQADALCFEYEDCVNTVVEYADYLTDDEMRACFRKAIKTAP